MTFTSSSFRSTETVSISGFNAFPVRELVEQLVTSGYRYCKPKATTWQSGLLLRRRAEVLCVLFRKNGVDLRYYPQYNGEVLIDDSNIASFSGGVLFRNHYKKSFQLHRRVQIVASKFASGKLTGRDIPGKMTSLQAFARESLCPVPQQPGLVNKEIF